MSDPLTPSTGLLCKLGSIVVHTDEYLGPDGQAFDLDPIRSLLTDPEVMDWVTAMNALALLPVKRTVDEFVPGFGTVTSADLDVLNSLWALPSAPDAGISFPDDE